MPTAQLLPGVLAVDEPPVPVGSDPGVGVDRDVGVGTVVGLRVVDGAGGATVVGVTADDRGLVTVDGVRGDEITGGDPTGEGPTGEAGPADDGAGPGATGLGDATGPAVADSDPELVPAP